MTENLGLQRTKKKVKNSKTLFGLCNALICVCVCVCLSVCLSMHEVARTIGQ